MNRVYPCNLCGETVLEITLTERVAALHHYECTCPGCGELGHFQVDADEDGTRAQWIAYEAEAVA